MNDFYNVFAMKAKPDETIIRIEELERQAKEMGDRLTNTQDKLDSTCNKLTDVEGQLTKVDDKVFGNHEPRIKALEE